MSRSNTAAISIADSSGSNQYEDQEPWESERTDDREPELLASEARTEKKKGKVPPHAILWGFVRRDQSSQLLRNVEVMPNDTMLWYDRKRHRFLVTFDKLIMDDLSPLEFVHFIRQLRKVSTQIVFKLETRLSGIPGRARRLWA